MFLTWEGRRRVFIKLDSTIERNVDQEKLKEQISSLRDNYSLAKRNYLVVKLQIIAVSVAARYATSFPYRKEDLLGVAFLELVRVLDAIALRGACAKHDNYFSYIAQSISGRCARYIERDHIVPAPYTEHEKRPERVGENEALEIFASREEGKLDDPPEAYFAGLKTIELKIIELLLEERSIDDIARKLKKNKNTILKYRKSAKEKIQKALYS